MVTRNTLRHGLLTFALTFVVAAAVSFLWNATTGGTAATDWSTAFRLAVIMGIVIPATAALNTGRHR